MVTSVYFVKQQHHQCHDQQQQHQSSVFPFVYASSSACIQDCNGYKSIAEASVARLEAQANVVTFGAAVASVATSEATT
ncbi:MAG: hypothetical protein Q8787_02795 [Sweet potato little leaf phytoplasma]|nr:hypothetical protein [Sweet potato little leaf phytoplasma]